MPNYPYRCLDCKKRFEIFMTYSEYGTRPVACPHCRASMSSGASGASALPVQRKAAWRTWSISDDLDGLEDDPRALGKMMRKMSREMGGEMEGEMGPEFNEMIDRLEAGQSPEEIESALPDLGSAAHGRRARGGMDDF